MSYKWDNKKPTAQMLGRWQPFHDGHYTLFKEIIKKTGQVCIQIRDVQGVDDNPFDFETVKKNIEEKLNPEFEGRFKIMMVPNITNICYGRGVGYKIEEIVLSEEIQKISATKIRAKFILTFPLLSFLLLFLSQKFFVFLQIKLFLQFYNLHLCHNKCLLYLVLTKF